MRKNLFYFLALIASFFTLTNCNDDDVTETSFLDISNTEITVGAENTTTKIQVKTNAGYKIISNDADWVTTTNNEDILSLNFAENKTGKDRKGVIVVSTNNDLVKKEINVSQSKDKSISTESDRLEIEADATEHLIQVVSSKNYAAECSADWLTIVEDNDNSTLKFRVTENKENKDREATINFNYEGKTINSILVVQKQHVNIVPDQTEMTVEATESEYSLGVLANRDYTLESDSEWITIVDNNKTSIKFQVNSNKTSANRTGNISFIVNEKVVTKVQINQKGEVSFTLPYLSFGKTLADVKSYEDKRDITKLLKETNLSDTGTQLKYSISNDPVFNEVQYLLNLKGYEKSSLFVTEGTITQKQREDFEALLLSKGYRKITEKGYNTTLDFTKVDKEKFVNDELQVKAEFMADDKVNHYTFTYFPVQQHPLTPLANFPNFEKWTSAESVKEFEANNNGTFDESKSKLNYTSSNIIKDKLHYDVENGEQGLIARVHYIYKSGANQGLAQTSYYYTSPNIALYGGNDGKYYLTNEFIEAAKQNGYKYSSLTSSGSYIFKNGTKRMAVRWLKDSNLSWTLRISFY